MGKVYTVKTLAEEFGVVEDTVRSWIRKGKLVAYKTSNRGGYLIAEEDVEAFCEAEDNDCSDEEPVEEDEVKEDEVTDDDILDELLYQNRMQIEEYEKQRDNAIARLRVLYVVREALESY